MTDQTNSPGGAPAPALNPAPPPAEMNTPPSSFVRDRVAQMQGAQPAPGATPDASAMADQQRAPAAEQKIKVGDAEYDAADVQSAIAERAEAASRKATLPATADAYEIKLPDGFQAPEGVRFEFDTKDPALKAARELAHKHGVDQALFSDMLGVFASTKMGEAIQQSQLRDINMRALGTAAPQRVEAVATWLQARAGPEGKAFGDFLRRFPSAQIVRATENLMRAFSNQGGADFSQSHRADAEDPGKIPGYEQMSFAQRRAAQINERMRTDPNFARGSRGERNER